MLQTVGDAVQQILRILIYLAAGGLATAGYLDESTSLQLAGAVVAALNGAWTIYWNRKQVVTVSGLQEAAKKPDVPVSSATVAEVKAAKT